MAESKEFLTHWIYSLSQKFIDYFLGSGRENESQFVVTVYTMLRCLEFIINRGGGVDRLF